MMLSGKSVNLQAAMEAGRALCSHCGTCVKLKLCARCKEVAYCGAECQKAAWRGHKGTCAPPQPVGDTDAFNAKQEDLEHVWNQVQAAERVDDWKGVLRWEGRMEELMENQPDSASEVVLKVFMKRHMWAMVSEGPAVHGLAVVRLEVTPKP